MQELTVNNARVVGELNVVTKNEHLEQAKNGQMTVGLGGKYCRGSEFLMELNKDCRIF